MKHFLYLFNFLTAIIFFFSSCEKAEPLKIFEPSVKPLLTITPTGETASFEDSLVSVLIASWTNPQFAQDKSLYKFILEIDSTGKNFSNSQTIIIEKPQFINDRFSYTIAGNELNNVLYALGLKPNQKYEVDFRLIASYGNNNERQLTETTTLELTPYPFPKVPIPTQGNLWITGDAVASGRWTNRPPDTQKFKRVSATIYELVIEMNDFGNYKLIQNQGDWETQYRWLEGNWESGLFELKNEDPGFVSPPEKGMYKLTFNFLTGTYSLTKQ